jgi:hypothetical protein
VLDLQMFPAMSKRHSELLQMYSNNEANGQLIWKVAQQTTGLEKLFIIHG